MWEWIVGVLLGFLSEFLRALYNDHVASSAIRENGRLEQENLQLQEKLRVAKQAKTIGDKVDEESNLNTVIDGL